MTGFADDERRVRGLRDTVRSASVLLRSPSRAIASSESGSGALLTFLTPEVRMTFNSALPNWSNDGALRAARGINLQGTAGAALRMGAIRIVIAPEFVAEQNLAYQTIPYPQKLAPQRSIWANPFHPLPESIDLPLRFGDTPHRRVTAGQSSVSVDAGALTAGVSNENHWWGPGIRNAIVLSNNAAGFPHVFTRMARPLSTRIGLIDFDLLAGTLRESEYFDANGSNDSRSLVAGALTWRSAGPPGLELGASRLRMAGSGAHEQLTSLFARWVIPGAGFETYAEWARFQDPKSVRDFLEIPNHSQGYTLGLQWQRPLALQRMLRLGTEATYLEPSTTFRIRPVTTSYTSALVPQGFTNRGEVLGASIGPGSSSQFATADMLAAAWRLGIVLGRTRFDNGTLLGPLVPELRRQDVTLIAGLRAAVTVRNVRLAAQFNDGVRLKEVVQADAVIELPLSGVYR